MSGARVETRSAYEVVGRLLAERYVATGTLGATGLDPGALSFAGHDIHSGVLVTIKVLTPAATSPSSLARFRRELTVARVVQHRNLCALLASGTLEGGASYLVVERLEGEPLSGRLRRDGALSAPDTVRLALEVLDALSAVHKAGLVHGDVRPENVFLVGPPRGPWERVKLVEFGRATSVAADRGDAAHVGTTVAALPYLAPELLEDEERARRPSSRAIALSATTDVWAAGLTLLEALTARRAFAGTPEEVTRQILEGAPVVPSEMARTLPHELMAVLARATAKATSERFATATHFRGALVEAWARHRLNGVGTGRRLLAGLRDPGG